MTKEEFGKACKEGTWLLHPGYGLIQAIHPNSMGGAWVAWRGEERLVYLYELCPATANDLLKEEL